ncbi:Serine/threonine-protein kinase [Coemansia sp. Benny D115]|nr:Serine/threonine-protein kinase [Coemansia sp. Benny D115]
MGQAASHSLVAAADEQPPLAMGVGGLETALGESLQHIRMLSSTRFTKTILCRLPREGQLVLRVFMRPVSMAFDPGPQILQLQKLYKKLHSAPHALAHARVVSDDRAVYILRQYLHTSLYDRISTRPFLAPMEKRWLARQLLEALREAHARGVCHGDIKAENVVVTTWNLAYLADFAPFKPTYLPADDPAEFNFYFDSAARQCCCIAPERFYDPGSQVAQRLATADAEDARGTREGLALQPAMDIFAAGCVIAELLLDGNPLFSLSRLLQYRRGLVSVEALTAAIADRPMAELVAHMIQRDADARLSAAAYLDRWDSLLPRAPRAAYMDTATPDERMQALFAEADAISDDTCEIVAAVACTAVRNCELPSSRCLGIKVMLKCSRGTMRGDLDVLLPHLVVLAGDATAQVRSEALAGIRQLLLDLPRLSPMNAGIFDDFLAPQLQYMAADPSVSVRCTVASVLGDWADSAHTLRASANDSFEAQMRAAVSRLSFDEAQVKHVLLCSFPQLYENRVQSLSHIITYLNDRDCWFLRAAFFDVVFAAAARISRHASREYVLPLVSLADSEAFVVVSALRALVRLAPQMSSAMCWDKLVEAYALKSARPELAAAATEFVEFLLTHSELPMPEDIARLALDMQASMDPQDDAVRAVRRLNIGNDSASAANEQRLVQLRDIGADLQTVFLTPVTDPWATKSNSTDDSSTTTVTANAATDAKIAATTSTGSSEFTRKKALDLEFPATTSASQRRLTDWRPKGVLLAEIYSEQGDATTHVVGVSGSFFVSANQLGSLHLFDGGSFRKNIVCRAHAVFAHPPGGSRVTGLVYHDALDCLVCSWSNGSIKVFRVACSGSSSTAARQEEGFGQLLASTLLVDGEYATSLGFGKGGRDGGVSVIAATSRSRVLFFSILDMDKAQDVICLQPRLGRLTCMTTDNRTLAVIGTSHGSLVLVDTRIAAASTTSAGSTSAAAMAESLIANNSARGSGPITCLAVLSSPAPMLVTGMQSGSIRVLI